MEISLELIDELRKRSRVNYSDAKDALEKSNGNILEALVYLENEKKVNTEYTYHGHHHAHGECCKGFKSKVKDLLHKGNTTRLVMFKKDRIVFSLSLTLSVIIGIVGIHFLIPAFLIALLTGHRFRLEGDNANIIKVNETFDKVSDAVDKVKDKITEEVKDIKEDTKEENK